jgi:anti-sigma factor RsiW
MIGHSVFNRVVAWRRALITSHLAVAIASTWAGSLAAQAPARPDRSPASDSIVIRASEGTALGFDVTPDGRQIVFDLLGQLWSIPI